MDKQLRMFMTPQEIMDNYEPNPFENKWNAEQNRKENNEELWARKADEADKSGLTGDIKEKGVGLPISLDMHTNTVNDGHHRVAAAHRLNPDQFMPIVYGHSYETHNAIMKEHPYLDKRYEGHK